MIKINKTVKLNDIEQHKDAISALKGNEIVQVITETASGDHSLKIVMTQEQFVELMNAKSSVALPKEIMDKVKVVEAIGKKVVKVMEIFQEDLNKGKKP